jgi:hypothetical protein
MTFKFNKRAQLFVGVHNKTLSVAAVRVSNPDCKLVLRQINCGHEKTKLSPLWPARCDACVLHLLRVPDRYFRSFRVDNVHACTQQKRWPLTIRRAPKFGTRVRLNVSIDGSQLASLGEGQSYNGTLSPGKHIISVNVTPGRGRGGTATKRVTVQAGQTYSLTASWSSDRVVLM